MDVRAVAAGSACLVLLVAGVALLRDDPAPIAGPARAATPDRVVTQPRWDPAGLADAPVSPLAFGIRPDTDPPTVREDPMTGVVVAWAEKGTAPRLLGTDGRWRAAPGSLETNQFSAYPSDPPAISSDGRLVAAAAEAGLQVLDATTGTVVTIDWPVALEPPWDWAPSVRWLPGDESVLVGHWNGLWEIGLDGTAARAPYPVRRGVYDVFGIDPEGPVHQNDWRRSTLVTWNGAEAVREVPFVQCERLVAAHGLVACTAGSLRSRESGPVVVDTETGEIVAYAPIRDPSAFYSDNGHLTVLGFTDPDTALLQVGTREGRWYLVAWSFRDGAFGRVTRGTRDLRSTSVAPTMLG